MLKAGLIGLAAGGLFGLGVTLLFPFCTPCAAIVIGLGTGFLACLWDKPETSSSGAGLGAKAGAIAGVGHLGGQLLGMAINGLLVGPDGAVEALEQLGLDVSMMDSTTYWVSQVVINGGCGITNIAIAAGLGALGGLLWHRTMGKSQAL
jgi:hypothetical protein